jgi:hypothetical protein
MTRQETSKPLWTTAADDVPSSVITVGTRLIFDGGLWEAHSSGRAP